MRAPITEQVGMDSDRNYSIIPYISIVFSRENEIIPIETYSTCSIIGTEN